MLAAFAALLLWSFPTFAQEEPTFNDVEALAELDAFAVLLGSLDADGQSLAAARARIVALEVAATDCADAFRDQRARLEERFEPLRDIDPDVVNEEMLAQRTELRGELDHASTRLAACDRVADRAQSLATAFSDRQKKLSQQFLSSRSKTVVELLKEFPDRAATWATRIDTVMDVDLVEGMSKTRLAWALLVAGLAAVFAGLWLRHGFRRWYEAAGGDEMQPQLTYLFPKPLTEFSPIWLTGAVLLGVLGYAIPDASSSLVIVRVAWAVLAFGVGLAIANWMTGPLSPSRDVEGLIPDHVVPLRRRILLVLFSICVSYIVLGYALFSVHVIDGYIAGRAPMILLVGASVFYLLAYLGGIPGLRRFYRLLRFVGLVGLGSGVVALFLGFHNFAAYLVQSITLTVIALFVLWTFLWLSSFAVSYLVEQESPAATQTRTLLGISSKRSKSGIGFMQLIADVVLWIGIVVFLISVWDSSGNTLTLLRDAVTQGWLIGEMRVVPTNILKSVLIFAALIVVVGWMKRWIDKRWLQRMVMERGARDAILTLFGYFGFVVAIILALVLAKVDLTGLAIISGALALGLGFGLQEIANNFVSGLILLFERPIRVGDFVTVGDVQGYVRSIRIRATEIETLDNQNVLVPNSELVSGRVTNWVLRDAHGRLCVKVGVAYGSDTELVREILERVGRENPDVITDGRAPAPRALFLGFGDSSLDFELRVRVKRIDSRFFVMSDLNFAIDQAFREAGVTIPFPQRDLHVISHPEEAQELPTQINRAVPVTSEQQPTRSHEEELRSACDVETIWEALTDLDTLKRWLVRDGSIEPRFGGKIDMILHDNYHVQGRIDAFAPPRRLRFRLSPGEEESAPSEMRVVADFTLRAEEDESVLHVGVSGIPESEDWEEFYRLSVDRWREALGLLKSDVLKR